MERRLELLSAKRENLFRRVQLCYDAAIQFKRDSSNHKYEENFKIRYHTIDKVVLEYTETTQEIINLKFDLDPEQKPDYALFNGFDDLHDNIQYLASELLKSTEKPLPTTPLTSNDNKPKVKLPRIELIKFDGSDMSLWPIFYANFKNMIHDKPEFSKGEKIQYLLGSLNGKALKTCSGIEPVPDNYDVIWKLLKDTYHDKKFLSNLYLDRITKFRPITAHHPTKLQFFLENFDTSVSSLKRLKIDDLSDYIITYLAMSKLSQETINAFELINAQTTDMPTYDQLISFVRQQSKIIVKHERLPVSDPHFKNPKTFFTNSTDTRSRTTFQNCISCKKQPHLLKDCIHFRNSTHDLKFAVVKDNNLCFNCFSSKHSASSCPSRFSCTICKKRHHTLGYIILGNTSQMKINTNPLNRSAFFTLDNLVEKMFELEDFNPPTSTKEDTVVEEIFVDNVKRDDNGRYTVSLPFKDDPGKLGNSYFLAEKRLLSLEKRFLKTPNLQKLYNSVIQDYLSQKHLSLVPESRLHSPGYYIPHHCIFKPESVSTPCRIVFDASMKSDTGVSLNDILYTGAKLQNHSIPILLNFRLFPIAFSSDVKQMYRQINIIESHRPYQRILWRFHPEDPIQVYELNTVTFGVKSSPFLSLRTVKQLANDEIQSFPRAVTYVHRDMYMDDLISSVPTVEEALDLYPDLINMFNSGGFQLVKWTSNSSNLLEIIPDDVKLIQPFDFNQDNVKILGLSWNPVTDQFYFKVTSNMSPCTKRNMLSLVARTFDPLGFLAPITLLIKLLIKNMWKLGIDWDVSAPPDIAKIWRKCQDEFVLLNKLEIPRHVLVYEKTPLTLIGFADASMSGFGAVVYLQTTNLSNKSNVRFLCAQSKVAPMCKITLPRLELCAATLLAKLLAHVRDIYSNRVKINNIYAFTDSSITLCWINSSTKKMKPFVGNRVGKIQACIPSLHWYYVPGKYNVSDCASRGLTPSSLLDHPTWFVGPLWLTSSRSEWPIKPFSEIIVRPEDDEKELVFLTIPPIISPLYSLINYFSSWTKLLNATVFVLRFVKILPKHTPITASHLKTAEMFLIRAVQQRYFRSEYHNLKNNKMVSSNLRRLCPFIKDGLIRVGGRLSNASLSYDHKHPILLPKSDTFVILLITYYHKLHHHAGSYLLQSLLMQNYWILSARGIIRQSVWRCNHCFRLSPKPTYPLMANLPFERVNQAKAFLSTGVDFTGAFQITLSRRRGVRTQKAYVCLFVCLATKAVHLELASDLSTECFIAAFKRFLARRGCCATLFSDCGTNFVGAKRYMDEVYQLICSRTYKDELLRELSLRRIEWKFNPPAAPHFGGIWEANVKSVKAYLTRTIGAQILTYEEFNTVLTQIEALLNSRPLCRLGNDPQDPQALTPAHFLYGTPLSSLPTEDLSDTLPNRLNRYKLLDSMVQHFWQRWHTEYLRTLQVRMKWNTNTNPVKEGMIVILIQSNIPSLQWPLAIIEKLHPGQDGIARVATIRTKSGTYNRPLVRLCPLPNQ